MRTALPRPCRILLVYAASTTLLPGAFALAASSAVSQEGPQLELAVVLLVSLAAIIGITPKNAVRFGINLSIEFDRFVSDNDHKLVQK